MVLVVAVIVVEVLPSTLRAALWVSSMPFCDDTVWNGLLVEVDAESLPQNALIFLS